MSKLNEISVAYPNGLAVRKDMSCHDPAGFRTPFAPLSEKFAGGRDVAGRADRLALTLLDAGCGPGIVARRLGAQAGLSPAEAELRLVEFALGALGRVAPFRPRGSQRDVAPREAAQASVLNLAAQAFPERIQRLGDRIYLDGSPIGIPDLVRRARAAGTRIRYPGLDPMDRALAGGPSVGGRKRRGERSVEGALTEDAI